MTNSKPPLKNAINKVAPQTLAAEFAIVGTRLRCLTQAVILQACVLSATMCVEGAENFDRVVIERIKVAENAAHITVASRQTNYYVLERTSTIQYPDFYPENILLGTGQDLDFGIPLGAENAGFFRVRAVARVAPIDSDNDGIDDLLELANAGYLDPLNPLDSAIDWDGDGVSNLEEARNGWALGSKNSPTYEEFSRRFRPAPLRVVRLSSTQVVPLTDMKNTFSGVRPKGAAVNNVTQVSPVVAVNSFGLIAYAADVMGEDGMTHPQIYVSKQLPDGNWLRSPVLTDAQSAATYSLGPDLFINDANTILVRRTFRDSSPFGPIFTTFLQIFRADVLEGNNRGQFQTVASADPLNLSSEFTVIDASCAYNNNGSVAFFARNASTRFLALMSAGGAVKIPLNETTVFTPLILSDTDEVILRVGDQAGSIRILTVPGGQPVWRLNASPSGFSVLGSRPCISPDGRIAAFYGEYFGPSTAELPTTGPGVFALVHPVGLTTATVASAKLIRIAGLVGNMQEDPGETWSDKNGNGIIDSDEEQGVVLSIDPDTLVGVNNRGMISFAGTARVGGVVQKALFAVQIGPYGLPVAGKAEVVMSLNDEASMPGGTGVSCLRSISSGAASLLCWREDGIVGHEAVQVALLTPLDVGVDEDRDGRIVLASDPKTGAHLDSPNPRKPVLFWVNSDHDENDSQDAQDDADDSVEDSADGLISSERDLEDFSRLRVFLGESAKELARGDLKLGLSWRNVVSGNPSIRVFPNLDPSGDRTYLKSLERAGRHVQRLPVEKWSMLVQPGHQEFLEAPALLHLQTAWIHSLEELLARAVATSNLHLIYEGVTPGVGELGVSLYDHNDREIVSGPSVWLELKPIKQMYENWTVGESNGEAEPQPPAQQVRRISQFATDVDQPLFSYPAPIADEEHDYFLYVHGWNMSMSEKERWAETVFKRLWHLGYKGRVGVFRWPCYQDDTLTWDVLIPNGYYALGRTYNPSEWNAWRSGRGLLDCLDNLNTSGYSGRIRMLAHSQGNVVATEALRLAEHRPVVHSYLAMQAALPAHMYDPTTESIGAFVGMGAFPVTANVFSRYWSIGEAEQVPEQWSVDSPAYAAPVYMSGAASKYVNFFNSVDFALSGWEFSQRLKPSQNPVVIGPIEYYYGLTSGFTASESQKPLRNLSFPEDTYEIFAMAAQGQSHALGAQGGVNGVFVGNEVDLKVEYQFGDTHPFHSGQFRSSLPARWAVWKRIMQEAELPTND